MPKIRKFAAYRSVERPYTRISKYKDKAFIRITPHSKVVRFNMGNPKKKFSHKLSLYTKSSMQIRDHALESARTTSNRMLELTLGQNEYFMRIKPFPHHILRENPLAAGAGADRFSTGMKKSFGKPIGQAVRAKKGQVIFEVGIDKTNLALAKKALQRANTKLPCSCILEIKENKKA